MQLVIMITIMIPVNVCKDTVLGCVLGCLRCRNDARRLLSRIVWIVVNCQGRSEAVWLVFITVNC